MCHENFSLDLHPSLNIVVGTNGSGKSSILTAIMVALGSKARSTSRGNNMGSLVKTGKSRAWIHVQIRIPEVGFGQLFSKYGAKVTVTRIINAEKGNSSYVIKDVNDRVVKNTTAADVQNICYNVGLFPDNELAMLSQESAKEFLVNATDKVKYEKLRRGLQQHLIDQERDAIAASEQQQHVLLERIKFREQNIDEVERRADATMNLFKISENYEKRLTQLEKEIDYRQLKSYKEAYAQAHANTQKAIQNQQELRSAESIQDEIAKVEEDVERYQNENTDKNNQLTDIKSQYDNQKAEVNRQKASYDNLERDATEIKTKIEEIEESKRVLVEKRDAADPVKQEAKRADLREKISAVKSEISSVHRKMSTIDEEVENISSSISIQESKVIPIRKECSEVKQRIEELKQQLSNAQRTNVDEFYHSREMKILIKLVDQYDEKNAFDKKPIGPLYRYLQLTEEAKEYASALEALWQRTLNSWWVETDKDRKLLFELARKANLYRPTILLRQNDNFDFSNSVPPKSSRYVRACDVILFQNPGVERILVDINRIESFVIVKSTDLAHSVCKDRLISTALAVTSVNKPGRNSFPRFQVVRSLAQRVETAPVRTSTGRSHIKVKLSEAQRKQQNILEISSLEDRLNELQERLQVESEKGRVFVQQRKDMVAKKAIERNKHDSLQHKQEDLRKQLNSIHDVDTDEIDAEIRDFETQIVAYHADLTDLEESKNSFLPVYREEKDKLRKAEELKNNTSEDIERIYTKLNNLQEVLRNLTADLTNLKHKHERVNRQISQLTETENALEKKHHEFYEKFKEKYDDLDQRYNNETVRFGNEDEDLSQYSTDKLNQLLSRHLMQENAYPDMKEKVAEARKQKLEVLQARKAIQENKNELQKLSRTVAHRRKMRADNGENAWECVKATIQKSYVKILNRRNFQGYLTIDDTKAKLTAVATPDSVALVKDEFKSEEGPPRKTRAMSTLSGGEKSFTQIALLMSVWESMQVGFVSMDEYDVFMDKANRTLSLRVLAETVNKQRMQCLLITPQSIENSALQGVEHKIFRLKPARESSNSS
mgnify:FL=1